jgi:hypothetical protein
MSRTTEPRTDDKGAAIPAGATFAPSYRVGSRHGADRVLIDSQAFTHPSDPDEAARIARDRRIETEAVGLYWDYKVVIVPPPPGIRGQRGVVNAEIAPGMTETTAVIFIQGPTFDESQSPELPFALPKPIEA